MNPKYQQILDRYIKLDQKLSDPVLMSNPTKLGEIAQEKSEIEETALKVKRLVSIENNILENESLIADNDTELSEIASSEIVDLKKEKAKLEKELEVVLISSDPNDSKNVIIEIRPAAGGEESELFSSEMLRAYLHFAEKQNWNTTMLTSQTTGINGLKYAAFEMKGQRVYAKMKYESGVHRVQRIPETEKSGRVHTSTITVAVLPEAKEADIEIKPEEIRVDVFRSSGPGGQSVNTTDSAVRITHTPTGIIVTCQDEKSQLKNKTKALNILRSRLLVAEEERLKIERGDARNTQIGSGDRSEKIRTYNFPQDRVTDHRIAKSWHGILNIMEGNFNDIINSLIDEDRARQLSKD